MAAASRRRTRATSANYNAKAGRLRHTIAACGGFVAPSGRHGGWGVSYRQLRSLRSLASGYSYVALRAEDAACGGKTRSFQPFTQRQEFFNLRYDAFLFGKRWERNQCFSDNSLVDFGHTF